MRLSKTLVDMDMADYSAALDPAYTTLEFENVQVLAMGNGRCGHVCPVCQGWMAEEAEEWPFHWDWDTEKMMVWGQWHSG